MYLKRHYDNDLAKKVLLKLEELKLINDKEYAIMMVDVYKKKGYGIKKVINELKSLDINDEYIFDALKNYSLAEMLENCEKAFVKYLPSLKKESKQASKKKLVNYLVSRGFDNDTIAIVIQNNSDKLDNISNEDELLYKAYNKLLKTKKDTIDEKKFKNKVIRSLTNKGFPLYKVLKVLEGDVNYD